MNPANPLHPANPASPLHPGFNQHGDWSGAPTWLLVIMLALSVATLAMCVWVLVQTMRLP